jgi:hypothetical protein
MQPSMEACAWIHQAQDRSWRPYVMRTPDAAVRPCVPHRRMCTTLGRFPTMATSIAGGPLYQGSATQDARSIKFFQDLPLLCPKHVGATATIFVAAQPNGTTPERTTDGCCHYHFKTSFKPDRSVSAGGGSADPARTSTEGAAPTTPPGGVIDCMRHWSIVGSVGPFHGPGRQRSHASAGQPGSLTGEDQLGPTTSHLGQCCRRTFRRTRRTNQMCSTISLLLRRRHHRLQGIHRRRHSDRLAATFRGSWPVSGPVAGRA